MILDVGHVGVQRRLEVGVLSNTADEPLQPFDTSADDGELQLDQTDLLRPCWYQAGGGNVRLLLQPTQPGRVRLHDLHILIGGQVQDLVHEIISPSLAHPRVRDAEALVESFGPTVPVADVVAHSAAWPIFFLIVVRLSHRKDGVEQRGARAEDGQMTPMNADGLAPVHCAHQAQLLHRREVVAPEPVDLGGALVNHILDAQRVETVLDSQRQQQG
mmetsp:Transcript_531/g.1420  ORF Transcript_531/g.1420 Transcript_531/m.1420 type:complete len:216 (-) Transcript_531:1440-2087(-)